jgi:protein-S-isoprenylcysteine O-methyltransferase Ste14
MTRTEKLKRDGAAISLFGVIVGGKLYSLWVYVTGNPDMWNLLRDIGSIERYGRGAAYFLTNELSYLLYFVTAIAFDALVFYSFVVRGEAKSRPQGAWENLFPLVTVFVPVIGFALLFVPQVRRLVPGYSPETLDFLRGITPLYGFYLSMIGLGLGFVGASFSIWAISHLRKSFGLRAAVRSLVSTGPYRRIRHPLYLGEIVHIGGIAVLSGKPLGLHLFVVAVALQVVRAKIEERKFRRTLPEYEAYVQGTGFLWPRLRRPGRRDGASRSSLTE